MEVFRAVTLVAVLLGSLPSLGCGEERVRFELAVKIMKRLREKPCASIKSTQPRAFGTHLGLGYIAYSLAA